MERDKYIKSIKSNVGTMHYIIYYYKKNVILSILFKYSLLSVG